VTLCRRIERLEIQGAEHIARAAVEGAARLMDAGAWNAAARERLLATRPTEPMIENALRYLERHARDHHPARVLAHIMVLFDESDERIAQAASGLIKDGQAYFTLCHSSTVVKAFLTAKAAGRRFSVHNLETRPRFQGRQTAIELSAAGIPVTFGVDSTARLLLKGCAAVFLGADALLKDGVVVNKIGSELVAELAQRRKIPVYVLASSWKFAGQTREEFRERLEVRSPAEVWPDAPAGVLVENPAFSFIRPGVIRAVITEQAVLAPQAQAMRLTRHWRRTVPK